MKGWCEFRAVGKVCKPEQSGMFFVWSERNLDLDLTRGRGSSEKRGTRYNFPKENSAALTGRDEDFSIFLGMNQM